MEAPPARLTHQRKQDRFHVFVLRKRRDRKLVSIELQFWRAGLQSSSSVPLIVF